MPIARGRAALARTLAWTTKTDWGEVAWSFSDLAGGSPVELVWRPGRPGLFWTAEPAPPEWPGSRRLERALALARVLGMRFVRGETRMLREMSASAQSPWPLWLSGRHEDAGDAAKLYMLTGGTKWDRHSPPQLAALWRQDDRLVMLGLSPDGCREFYWRRLSPQPGDCWRMASEPCLEPLAVQLDRALIYWTGHGLDSDRRGPLGLSVKLSATGQPEALAAFLRVRQAGPEESVRERLLRGGGEANPAIARLWAARRMRPMFLTLAATPAGVLPSLGLRISPQAAS